MPIANLTRNTTLAISTEIADTSFKRMQGLLGKDRMDENSALVITHCNSIHMLFMKFAIDVIFVNQEYKVVGLVKNIQPFYFSPIFWDASCAIELSAGIIEKTKTQIGDQIEISKT